MSREDQLGNAEKNSGYLEAAGKEVRRQLVQKFFEHEVAGWIAKVQMMINQVPQNNMIFVPNTKSKWFEDQGYYRR